VNIHLLGTGDPNVNHCSSQQIKEHINGLETSARMAQFMESTAPGHVPGSSLNICEDDSTFSPAVTVGVTNHTEQVFTIIVCCRSMQSHAYLEAMKKGERGTTAQSLRLICCFTLAKERFARIESGLVKNACPEAGSSRHPTAQRETTGSTCPWPRET